MANFMKWLCVFVFSASLSTVSAQYGDKLNWSAKGDGYYDTDDDGSIAFFSLADRKKKTVLTTAQLTPKDSARPLLVKSVAFSRSNNLVLIFTNSKKVWRYETRGDYWLYDLAAGRLTQLGKGLPSATLMFAKISPDEKHAAYVSRHNLYVEDLATHEVKPLTTDGSRQVVNGTFDWVYEEEFDCRDGFRWSGDSKQIAYWKITDLATRDYLMLNTTDSVYSHVVPVEYPVAGQKPGDFAIGVADIATAQTKWMNIPTDPRIGSYVPRMDWANNNDELIIQHLNRRQNESEIQLCNVHDGSVKTIFSESDTAWVDAGAEHWTWVGQSFLWISDRDGWSHVYLIGHDGKKAQLITKGNYDVVSLEGVDPARKQIYFIASPDNATQRYLYRAAFDGKAPATRVSPANQAGTHSYDISPDAHYAMHGFSNHFTPGTTDWVTLPDHKPTGEPAVDNAVAKAASTPSRVRFFQVTSADGVTMDGWMSLPPNFDSAKKYPLYIHVYSEPAHAMASDEWGVERFNTYLGHDPSRDGYITMAFDGRGSPVPKGKAWRKALYRKIGVVNIRDQAQAALQALKWPFIDTARVAVTGWSGGGSATLNLMFQYPEIYKTGIAVAGLNNLLTYDNVYEERYMGIPEESMADYVRGSAITYAKNLRGNLLYIHGTGDDNVHYNNAEQLVNELIRYNRPFQFMAYPNRTHAIYEGENTRAHLEALCTRYVLEHCPPGPR